MISVQESPTPELILSEPYLIKTNTSLEKILCNRNHQSTVNGRLASVSLVVALVLLLKGTSVQMLVVWL